MALTLVGGVLRFWKLGELPAQIDNDIPWVGTVALQLITSGDYSWLGMNVEAAHLQSYPQFYAWSMRLFGQDLFGLIVTSAIAGTLTLPVVYALGREMFHPRVGLIAMALLAINYTHIHFSRTMFGSKVTLCAALAMYLLFRGLRRREPVWFALGGLAAGVGLLLYDSSRVIPVVCLGVLLWLLIWQREQVRANLWGIMLFGLGLFVGFGPMLSFALTHFDLFLGRGHDVTIWSPGVWQHAVSVYGVSSVPEVLFNQTMRTLLTFHLYGDSSPQFTFTRPMVEALTAAFLVVGTGVLLFRLRDVRAVGLLMWVGLTLLGGGILTYDPPFWPHLNIALPAVMLIAAVGVHTCTEVMARSVERWLRPLIFYVLIVAIGVTGLHSWAVYYTFAKDNAGPRNRMARYINTLPRDYRVILVSDEYTPDTYAFRFFNREAAIEHQIPIQLEERLPSLEHPLLFLLHEHDELLPTITAQYPNGELIIHTDRVGGELFRTYRVMPPGYPVTPVTTSGSPAFLWVVGLMLIGMLGWVMRSWWGHRPVHRKRQSTAMIE